MRYLSGTGEKEAFDAINTAAEIARGSKCLRSKCGAVIIADGVMIGAGYNSPPGDEGKDVCEKDYLPKDFKSDKTCCVHAEQRAIIDAVSKHPDKVKGSTLYFARLGRNNRKEFSGRPYCTICSKMALDVGISEFVLMHEDGICAYGTTEYNTLSFEYRE